MTVSTQFAVEAVLNLTDITNFLVGKGVIPKEWKKYSIHMDCDNSKNTITFSIVCLDKDLIKT